MHSYKAPLEDMQFLLDCQAGIHPAEKNSRQASVDREEASFILSQAAQFVEHELAPINRACDELGCRFDNGNVSLPNAMKQAYTRYAEAGWMGLSMPEEWGGQQVSSQLAACAGEMLTSANHAFSMIPALNMSAIKALLTFGSEELKSQYLPNMISGQWLGCMALTEAHCGSDLGLIRTSAELVDDNSYRIKGNKIFISAGAHDGCENIVHLVLARIKGAPEGVKGLSLFIVPTYLPNSREFNNVSCIGIEEKMGIHSNPTCTMSYENSTGFLVGEPHKGIKAMFIMMNEMRMGTATQGIGLSEISYQHSLSYATERRQGRSLKGIAEPDQEADSLLVHADIRRMLLTQRAFAEGGRALSFFCAQLLDVTEEANEKSADTCGTLPSAEDSKQLLNFLTPIAKAFCTETGLESSSLAIQVFGGHGYVRESGVEQLYRDGRISTLYEGTTGIQSLDLLGRKVLGTQAKSLLLFTKQIHRFCLLEKGNQPFSSMVKTLLDYAKEWPQLTQEIGIKAMKSHDEVGAAAYDYLMYSGYVTLAYFWLSMAVRAARLMESKPTKQQGGNYGDEFLNAKIRTASFYYSRLLPRAESHRKAMLSGEDALLL
ncbi:acyl-CoA dehydrogenase C-terminal domain-containing protein [Alkalimarinus coralli]|uniref:acyl-CoA dehydrogenase C-terminal domain-containing protein n=1 Tax=Alkalimarinus coralli TaxID=2935863 RepID=UPI00202AC572|nr:acyl-CoA dehydrogenase C-terminal domain-containing protein [Alkalimarinus coralli]